jgi:hypothetical protein
VRALIALAFDLYKKAPSVFLGADFILVYGNQAYGNSITPVEGAEIVVLQ